MLSMMLDSGAYSAWKSGRTIDLQAYADYIKALGCADGVVNLDVIPGKYGKKPTPMEVEDSAKQSLQNYEKLKVLGIDSIPVFHQGEQWHWLEAMVELGIPYIGISPANDKLAEQRKEWLDDVFTRLTDISGNPIIKTHGFGMTTVSLMNRYPWYSCDSITWILNGSYGQIMIPVHVEGKWDYKQRPKTLMVSSRYGHTAVKYEHYTNLSTEAQAVVRRYVETECNLEFRRVEENYEDRIRCNLHYFLGYEEARIAEPFTAHTSCLFSDAALHSSRNSITIEKMKLILAENFSHNHSRLLAERKVKNRLISYAMMRQKPLEVLQKYILSDGVYPVKRRKLWKQT